MMVEADHAWTTRLPAGGLPELSAEFPFEFPLRLGNESYHFEVLLAPGEDLQSLDCVGSSSLTSSERFDAFLHGWLVRISGVAEDHEAIECTLTTNRHEFGDVNCDGSLSILDAAIIAQRTVGLRPVDSPCPVTPGANEINPAVADTNDDGIVNILDAVRVAQCVVEHANSLCGGAAGE